MGCGSSSQPTVALSTVQVPQPSANQKTDGETTGYVKDGVPPELTPSNLKKKDLVADVHKLSKVDEHAQKTDENARDDSLPEPKPSNLEIKGMIADVQEFSKVDENAKRAGEEMTRYAKDGTLPEPRPSTLRKKDLIADVREFSKVDAHARKAPQNLRQSLPDLVNYLGKASKDPLYLVRSFFVWCAENIRYDTDGFFGRTRMSPCDYEQAKIPVKKLSGYAKGYGDSPENPFSTSNETDHAWNAVFVRGHWFLIDGTWGAGHLGEDNQFKAKFEESYFLADPECFALSHFPYFHEAPAESMKWQLLEKPLSIETFNRLLNIKPAAYTIGLQPSSHRDAIIEFEDDIELTFKEKIPRTIRISTRLWKKEIDILKEKKYCVYRYWSNGYIRIKIMPPESGSYSLEIFGAEQGDKHTHLYEYILHCNVSSQGSVLRNFPYPMCYPQAYDDECQILEPLGKQIPPETEIKMRFQSPHLNRMMIGSTMLKKTGDIFEGTTMSPKSGYVISVYGSRSESGSLDGLYEFAVA